MSALWTSDEIAAATGGTASTPFEVTGVTFDSREVEPGFLFIAMPGTVHDGHKFVDAAFASGAAGALVSQPVVGPHVLVADTFAALEALGRAALSVHGTAATFAHWTRTFMARPNELPDFGQEMFQRAGGDPEIFYLHGYCTLRPGEAWVIETDVPDCPYWNFQLGNWWMESLDHSHKKITVNKHTAVLDADGRLTIVVAHRDPGVPNWIDTCGHGSGTALLRWLGAAVHPIPKCRVVSLEEIR